VWQPYFERLRRDDPVHYVKDSAYGPYWAISKYRDIVRLEVNHPTFSSSWKLGGIKIEDMPIGYERPSFIWLDPPEHSPQRLAVSPAVNPVNLAKMEGLINERTQRVLDALPRGETFDWVDRVSIELTSMMLATLFGYPIEDSRKLVYWSEVVISDIKSPDALVRSEAERFAIQMEFTEHLNAMWEERAKLPPSFDLISMFAHSDVMSRQTMRERMGTLILFLVGGNDTTRNSMSGGVWAFSQFPGELKKLRENRSLIPGAVSEIIRWQTPVIHMRRTAVEDVEFGGKRVRKGDKVVVWYLSGNRDGDAIERADEFVVDRARPREHLSFGFGIHRCLGNRLAELQLRILWEEILQRDLDIEVLDRPVYAYSNFLRGIRTLPVRIRS
ncbi:MAG TPA: cytochrome P450, partial [Rhodopila sp.]